MSERYDLLLVLDIGGTPLLEYQFHEDKPDIDTALLGGFLSAINSFAGTMVRQEQSLEKIGMGELDIMFVSGKETLGVIIGAHLDPLSKQHIYAVLVEFEEEFKELIEKRAFALSQFDTFIPRIHEIFAQPLIAPYLTPVLLTQDSEILASSDVAKLIARTTRPITLLEICELLNIPLHQGAYELRKLLDSNAAKLEFSLTAGDVLIPLPASLPIITRTSLEYFALRNELGVEPLNILELLDGRTFLADLTEAREDALLKLIEPLLTKNLVRLASSWEKAIVEVESFQPILFQALRLEFPAYKLEKIGEHLIEIMTTDFTSIYYILDFDTGGIDPEKLRIMLFSQSYKDATTVLDIITQYLLAVTRAIRAFYSKKRMNKFIKRLVKGVPEYFDIVKQAIETIRDYNNNYNT